MIQEYLGASVARNTRAMDYNRDCISWRIQETPGKLRVLRGGTANALEDWEELLQKRFRRDRTIYRNQTSLAQLPKQFVFCFEEVKRKLANFIKQGFFSFICVYQN